MNTDRLRCFEKLEAYGSLAFHRINTVFDKVFQCPAKELGIQRKKDFLRGEFAFEGDQVRTSFFQILEGFSGFSGKAV